jgi:BASS family bile acid:Na+ symporter
MTLGFIMFGIGSSLKIRDFIRTFARSKALYTGLGLQLIFLPLLAIFIISFAPIDPIWKLGIFIVSISPGGTSSNLISYLAKADVALSVTLTSFNSFIILFSIPILTNFAITYYGFDNSEYALKMGNTVVQIILIVLIPVVAGVYFNRRFPIQSHRIQKPLRNVILLMLATIFSVKFLMDEQSGGSGLTIEAIKVLLPYCLMLHLSAIVVSYIFSLLIRIRNQQSLTIAIEVGLQNTTLSLLITATFLDSNEMSQPSLVFALFSFFTTLAFALLAKRFGHLFRKKIIENTSQ